MMKQRGYLSLYALLISSLLFIAVTAVALIGVTESSVNANALAHTQAIYLGESKIRMLLHSQKYREQLSNKKAQIKEQGLLDSRQDLGVITIDASDMLYGDTQNRVTIEYYRKTKEIELSAITVYKGIRMTTKAFLSTVNDFYHKEIPYPLTAGSSDHDEFQRLKDAPSPFDASVVKDSPITVISKNGIVGYADGTHDAIFHPIQEAPNSVESDVRLSTVLGPMAETQDEQVTPSEPSTEIAPETPLVGEETIEPPESSPEESDSPVESPSENEMPPIPVEIATQDLPHPTHLYSKNQISFSGEDPIVLEGVIYLTGVVEIRQNTRIKGICILKDVDLSVVDGARLTVEGQLYSEYGFGEAIDFQYNAVLQKQYANQLSNYHRPLLRRVKTY